MPISDKFNYEISGGEVTITGYTDCPNSAGDILIPATINDGTNTYNVVSISSMAFANCSLTSITISNSVTSIGYGAFINCVSLKGVTISNSVTSIGNFVFAGCRSLLSIEVESGNSYFSSTEGVLYNNSKTTLLCYPGGKPGLFTIPSSVTIIGNYGFYSCLNLESINIPNTVTSIDNHAFGECRNLKSVTISDNVTSIGDYAFAECISLKSVTIPNNVTSIGDFMFRSCRSLLSIEVESGNSYFSSIEGVLYNNSKTTLMCYPGGKTGLFTIPSGVTEIKVGAFAGCINLTSVNIPNSVTRIDTFAFGTCRHLVSAYFFGDAPSMDYDVFVNNASNFKIYYLHGSTGFSTPTWLSYNTEPFYMVTYDGNGSTSGTIPEDNNKYLQGETVIVLGNVGSLVKGGYTFIGWNTKADGTGTNYAAGASFTIENTNMTLYANWQRPILVWSKLIGTLLTYNDGYISNIEKMIIKDGYHSIVTIPSSAESGNTFTLSTLTLNTSTLSNSYIKLDFTSNIVTAGDDRKISFQVFKLYQNILITVGSMWVFSGSREASTLFSFSVYDYDSYYDENPVYSVVATIL